MLIRELNEADFTLFWNLRFSALMESPDAFGATYEEEVNKPIELLESIFINYIAPKDENFVLGAFDKNNLLIGMVGLRREKRIKLRHKANFWGMYVLSDYRKEGVGNLLMSQLISKGKSMEGLEQINLCVVSDNIKAKKLYKSFGFLTYGTEQKAMKIDNRYLDEYLMVLYL